MNKDLALNLVVDMFLGRYTSVPLSITYMGSYDLDKTQTDLEHKIHADPGFSCDIDWLYLNSRRGRITLNERSVVLASINFIPGVLSGASCEHTNILVIEDSWLMDPKVLEEAKLIPAKINGIDPLTIILG